MCEYIVISLGTVGRGEGLGLEGDGSYRSELNGRNRWCMQPLVSFVRIAIIMLHPFNTVASDIFLQSAVHIICRDRTWTPALRS